MNPLRITLLGALLAGCDAGPGPGPTDLGDQTSSGGSSTAPDLGQSTGDTTDEQDSTGSPAEQWCLDYGPDRGITMTNGTFAAGKVVLFDYCFGEVPFIDSCWVQNFSDSPNIELGCDFNCEDGEGLVVLTTPAHYPALGFEAYYRFDNPCV